MPGMRRLGEWRRSVGMRSVMGTFPQGGGKVRLKQLGLVGYYEDYNWFKKVPRPDRYKSYRARRRFKRLVLVELLDAQRSKYMRTIEDVLEEG